MSSDNSGIGGIVGLGVGLGFGLAAINILRGLPIGMQDEIQIILEKSSSTGNPGERSVIAQNYKVPKAISLLRRAKFKIIKKEEVSDNLTKITFKI